MKVKYLLLTFLFVVLSLFIIFWVVPYFTQPVGVPLDFYEISDNLTESNMDIYYLGSGDPFNKRVDYIHINDLSKIPVANSNPLKAIVIDFKLENDLTEIEYAKITDLYTNQCYLVVLIDYKSGGLDDIIDEDNLGDDIILLDFTSCGEIYFSSSIELPTDIDLKNTQYLITHLLEKTVDDE